MKVGELRKRVRQKKTREYFIYLAMKKKYKLTKEDLKKIPRPYYKHTHLIKKLFDPQKKLGEFDED